jgi:CRP/FNR family transcriptional regulator, cyclic AMP receptor protein
MGSESDYLLRCARFARDLSDEHRERVARELVVRNFAAGAFICRKGGAADCWVGIESGDVKIQVVSAEGRGTTLATFTEGCWFGEGTLLNNEPWPFDAIALTHARIAHIRASTFHWLLNNSLPFNRFIIDQLNARLGQFIRRCEHARLHQTDRHVAHCIGELLDPRLYPLSSGPRVRMSQEELAHLAGVSRAMVNKVLHELARSGIVEVSYGSISLIDPQALRRFSESSH